MYLNLKAEMARNGVTQAQVAKVADVSTRTVYSWLCEHTRADVQRAIDVKNKLFPSMDIEYLFKEEKEKG